MEYKLEKQKLEDKNIAISEAYDFASDLETKVDVCNLDFGNSNMSKQDQEKNNKNLRENISKKENTIDSLKIDLNNKELSISQKTSEVNTLNTTFTSLQVAQGTLSNQTSDDPEVTNQISVIQVTTQLTQL